MSGRCAKTLETERADDAGEIRALEKEAAAPSARRIAKSSSACATTCHARSRRRSRTSARPTAIARASLNANEVLRTVTKPSSKRWSSSPASSATVRVGEKAEHRKFKVTGEVVSIDGEKAVLNVNGRKMTVEMR